MDPACVIPSLGLWTSMRAPGSGGVSAFRINKYVYLVYAGDFYCIVN